jgi:hypothetical protein
VKIPTLALPAIVALCAALELAALSAAPGTKTFSGIISDDICVKGDHSHMRMGATDAECAIACVSAHDAAYVLYDGRNFYRLSGPQALETFAGRKVKITGELDPKTQTIRIDSITNAK